MKGPPDGEEVGMAELLFWLWMIMDIHWPNIKKFGRYSYANAELGRETTPDEEKWLDETEHFGEVDAETAAKVKEDVLAGRWTPLRDGTS